MSSSISSSPANAAAKAIIHGSDGRVLMQKRDSFKELPFPNHWTFFGGLTEPGEAPQEAIVRELTEELGCVPGTLQPELFQWTWKSDWASTRNHFFPVRFESSMDRLILHEGQEMKWFSPDEMTGIQLTPAVYENFSKVTKFLSGKSKIEAIEESLLVTNNLRRKNDRVFYARANPFGISRQQIFLLKELACLRNIPVFRCCLHDDDENDIHEMLMIHTRPNSIGPLKQNKTSLSYHIFEGEMTIRIHDDSGSVKREYHLGGDASIEPRITWLRLNASEYRSVHSTSPFSIFLEVASGPFQDADTLWFSSLN